MIESDFSAWLESALIRELAEIPLPALHPAAARYRVARAARPVPAARRSLAVAAAFALALTTVVVAAAAPATPAARTFAAGAGRLVHNLIGRPPLDSDSKPRVPAPESDRRPAVPSPERPATPRSPETRSDAERGGERPSTGSHDADANGVEARSQQSGGGEHLGGASPPGREDSRQAADGGSHERTEEKTSDFSPDRGYSGNSVTKPSGNGNHPQEEST